jgi:hypothetical protein
MAKAQPKKSVEIEDISTESLMCRDMMHQFGMGWQHDYVVVRHENKPILITRYFVCPVCKSEAWDDLLVPSLERHGSRRIKHSEDYLRQNVDGVRLTKGQVRREWYTRTIGNPDAIANGRRVNLQAR